MVTIVCGLAETRVDTDNVFYEALEAVEPKPKALLVFSSGFDDALLRLCAARFSITTRLNQQLKEKTK